MAGLPNRWASWLEASTIARLLQSARPGPPARRARPARAAVVALLASTAWLTCTPVDAAEPALPAGAATAAVVGDQQGTEFRLMFVAHRAGARQALYITGEAAANGVVSMPGLPASSPSPAFSQPFSVVPGVTTFVQLPPEASMSPDETLADRGVRVVANGPVSVVAVDYAGASSAAYLAMPVVALGTRHVVLAQGGAGLRAGSEFGVVATQAGTVLTITPKQAAQGHAAGVPFQVVLGPSQTWQMRSEVEGGDLSGSVVDSTAPIAVFAGHSCVDLDKTGSGCDLVADAIPPVASWGRRFFTVPLLRAGTSAGADLSGTLDATTDGSVRIVAANDDTEISIDGENTATLARGEVYLAKRRAPVSITANQPVMVAQYARSAASGAVQHVVTPVDQYRSAYVFGTPDLDHVVDLVVAGSGAGGIVLDGVPVPASRFVRIAPTDFMGARVPLVSEGAHSITGTVPFNATVQWSGKGGAYVYSGGQSWQALHFEPPRMCDADNNGSIDTHDIALVLLGRGTRTGIHDLRDANKDGVIDIVDARQCALQCSKQGCAP